MKNLIVILISFLALSAAGYAQETKQQEEKSSADTVKVVKESKQADDTKPGRKDRMRKRDRFIDKDGDGINDRRCTGMGLHNCHRKGKNCKHKERYQEQNQNKGQNKKQK